MHAHAHTQPRTHNVLLHTDEKEIQNATGNTGQHI